MIRVLLKTSLFLFCMLVYSCGGGGGEGGQPPATPQPPQNVRAFPGNQQIYLKWDSVQGATSYNIYWAFNSGVKKTSGTKIGGIQDTFYFHNSLTNGTTYYYVVTAVNQNGESAESNEASATPSYNPPPPPQP